MGQDLYAESLRTFMGPINEYMDDAGISEVMINGYKDVFIEKGGKIVRVKSKFDERGLMTLAINIAQFVGRQLSVENPRLDARLPDGSRIHIVVPPIAKNGVVVSIRKFFKEKLTVKKLIGFGSFTPEAARFIQVSVELAKNMIISGGTGSGKTTLLNVLSNYIPPTQRIITMEDALELQLGHEHVVRFETRPKDKQGKGEVSMGDLLHSSLRLRPDRIILGEVRGGECFDLLQAMNTGHGGSMATTHANTPFETLGRLESLILLGGIDLPLRAIRSQISAAIQVIISAARYSDGSRRVSHISEVLPLNEKGDYQIQDIFIYTQTGKDENGKIVGYFAPTGVVPTFFNKIKAAGYKDIDLDFFNPLAYGFDPPSYFMGDPYFKDDKLVYEGEIRKLDIPLEHNLGDEDEEEKKEVKVEEKVEEKPKDKPKELNEEQKKALLIQKKKEAIEARKRAILDQKKQDVIEAKKRALLERKKKEAIAAKKKELLAQKLKNSQPPQTKQVNNQPPEPPKKSKQDDDDWFDF